MWLLVASLLWMVVCAGAFALLYVRADARVQVLAAARTVAAGQTITVADLRVVRVVPDDSIALVSATRAAHVVGASAVVPLVKGSLLVESQVGPAAWPPPGQAVVAVPVKAGRLAAGVSPGVRVLVIAVAKDGETQSAPSSSASASPVTATVIAVAAADSGASWVVSLLVARQDAVRVAGASADASIAVAQD